MYHEQKLETTNSFNEVARSEEKWLKTETNVFKKTLFNIAADYTLKMDYPEIPKKHVDDDKNPLHFICLLQVQDDSIKKE